MGPLPILELLLINRQLKLEIISMEASITFFFVLEKKRFPLKIPYITPINQDT